MIKLLLYITLILFVIEIHSQQTKLTVLKSTISTVGNTSLYTLSNNKKSYKIQQSIGQPSIIGTKNTSNATIQQGFLNNIKVFNINNSNIDIIDKSLNLVISPNPFTDYIILHFSKETVHNIHILIYDMNGKVRFTKKYSPTEKLLVPLKHYSIGTYIIHVQSGNGKFIRKLLKPE